MSGEKARRWTLADDMIQGTYALDGPGLAVDETVEVAEVAALRAAWEAEQLDAMRALLAAWEAKPTEDYDERTYRGGGIDALKEAMSPRIIVPSDERGDNPD